MNNLSKVELAYLAGILDGEGCITMHKATMKNGEPMHRVVVIISNTNLPLLSWVVKITGMGSIQKHSYRSISKLKCYN